MYESGLINQGINGGVSAGGVSAVTENYLVKIIYIDGSTEVLQNISRYEHPYLPYKRYYFYSETRGTGHWVKEKEVRHISIME